MTEKPDTQSTEPRLGVLDPAWEDELRRGQEAEGESGSVEPELELLHLLRHVREPDALQAPQLDALWSSIAAEVAPTITPWWRKAWLWWSAPAIAATAVLAVIVLQDPAEHEEAAVAREESREVDRKRAPELEAPSPARAEQSIAGEGAARSGAAATASDALVAKDEKDEVNEFEQSFQQLAPYGRRAIRGSLDESYDDLRSHLLADAKGATP